MIEKTAYQNNPNLKKVGVPIPFTAEQIREYNKCAKSYEYFLDKYFKQITLDEGFKLIKLRKYQKKLLKTIDKNRFTIAKIGRQSGKTSSVVGYILHSVLFNNHFTVATLGHKQDIAIEILTRVKMAYEAIPLFLQQGITSWAEKYIELENGSRIIAEATSSGSITGFTINLLFIDEMSKIEYNTAEAFWRSVYPTVTSGKKTKVIITSTPNGLGNLFYRLWKGAIEGENDYVPVEVHWSEVPGRDEKWAQAEIKNNGQKFFDQEYDGQFIGSSNTLISGPILRNLMWTKSIAQPIQDMDIWEYPNAKRLYALTADVAEGTQQDYSAFSVFDVTEYPYKQIARYRNNLIDPSLFPHIIHQAALYYNGAYVLIENNSQGAQVNHILFLELEYDNIFWTVTSQMGTEPTAAQQMMSKKPGLRTTRATKMVGCTSLKTLIENSQLIINDADTISELSVFELTRNGSYAAAEGHNDDLAMTLVLFSWLTRQPLWKDITNHELRQKLWNDKIRQIEESMPPMPKQISQTNPKQLEDKYFKMNGDIWEIVDGSRINPSPHETDFVYQDLWTNYQ